MLNPILVITLTLSKIIAHHDYFELLLNIETPRITFSYNELLNYYHTQLKLLTNGIVRGRCNYYFYLYYHDLKNYLLCTGQL